MEWCTNSLRRLPFWWRNRVNNRNNHLLLQTNKQSIGKDKNVSRANTQNMLPEHFICHTLSGEHDYKDLWWPRPQILVMFRVEQIRLLLLQRSTGTEAWRRRWNALPERGKSVIARRVWATLLLGLGRNSPTDIFIAPVGNFFWYLQSGPFIFESVIWFNINIPLIKMINQIYPKGTNSEYGVECWFTSNSIN